MFYFQKKYSSAFIFFLEIGSKSTVKGSDYADDTG